MQNWNYKKRGKPSHGSLSCGERTMNVTLRYSEHRRSPPSFSFCILSVKWLNSECCNLRFFAAAVVNGYIDSTKGSGAELGPLRQRSRWGDWNDRIPQIERAAAQLGGEKWSLKVYYVMGWHSHTDSSNFMGTHSWDISSVAVSTVCAR